ncbi:MAG TPA: hypothetical protein VEA69_10465 [Tepidisphaeraceae bacterium]|nr:hypothetical protein [Tepidisphaeraceae bacterium]
MSQRYFGVNVAELNDGAVGGFGFADEAATVARPYTVADAAADNAAYFAWAAQRNAVKAAPAAAAEQNDDDRTPPPAAPAAVAPMFVVETDGAYLAAQSSAVRGSTLGALTFASVAAAVAHAGSIRLDSTAYVRRLECAHCAAGRFHASTDCRASSGPAMQVVVPDLEGAAAPAAPVAGKVKLVVGPRGKRFVAAIELPTGRKVKYPGTFATEQLAWDAAQRLADRHRGDVDLTGILARSIELARASAA